MRIFAIESKTYIYVILTQRVKWICVDRESYPFKRAEFFLPFKWSI